MEELTIDGKTYISSKKAAKVTGYAKDYIGQLCREGRVEAKLVGRSWYVYEPSLTEHRFNDERVKHRDKASEEVVVPQEAQETPKESPLETVWEAPSYAAETVELLPELEPAAAPTNQEKAEDGAISHMQSAWQDWFAERQEPQIKPVQEPVRPMVREVEAPREVAATSVPLRPIVSDIMPSRPQEYTPIVHEVRRSPQERRKASAPKGRIGSALAIAAVLICVSITLVATGLLDALHLGGISNTPIIQFLQGSQVLEK